jgi:hypothetical protein
MREMRATRQRRIIAAALVLALLGGALGTVTGRTHLRSAWTRLEAHVRQLFPTGSTPEPPVSSEGLDVAAIRRAATQVPDGVRLYLSIGPKEGVEDLREAEVLHVVQLYALPSLVVNKPMDADWILGFESDLANVPKADSSRARRLSPDFVLAPVKQ